MPKAPVVDGMSPEAKKKLAQFLAKFYLKRMEEAGKEQRDKEQLW